MCYHQTLTTEHCLIQPAYPLHLHEAQYLLLLLRYIKAMQRTSKTYHTLSLSSLSFLLEKSNPLFYLSIIAHGLSPRTHYMSLSLMQCTQRNGKERIVPDDVGVRLTAKPQNTPNFVLDGLLPDWEGYVLSRKRHKVMALQSPFKN